MVSKFKRICVFCGSSQGKKSSYQDAAIELGKELVFLFFSQKWNFPFLFSWFLALVSWNTRMLLFLTFFKKLIWVFGKNGVFLIWGSLFIHSWYVKMESLHEFNASFKECIWILGWFYRLGWNFFMQNVMFLWGFFQTESPACSSSISVVCVCVCRLILFLIFKCSLPVY